MNKLEKEILEKYQVRKTKQQKAAFIRLLQSRFPELKIQEGGFPKNRNLILGDVDTAKVLLTAHYDTCNASWLPNLMVPMLPWFRSLYSLLIVGPMLAIALLAGWLAARPSGSQAVLLTVYLLVYAAMFLVQFVCGIPNRHNANDNTSGVITLLRTYSMMTDAEKEITALVFFDNEEYGCRGSEWMYKQRKEAMAEKLVINFDCVADGDHFLLLATADGLNIHGAELKAAFAPGDGKAVTIADSKNAKLSSDHKHFPRSVGIAAMHENKWLKLCTGRIHTRRDTIFQEENIDFLATGTKAFLESLT